MSCVHILIHFISFRLDAGVVDVYGLGAGKKQTLAKSQGDFTLEGL